MLLNLAQRKQSFGPIDVYIIVCNRTKYKESKKKKMYKEQIIVISLWWKLHLLKCFLLILITSLTF